MEAEHVESRKARPDCCQWPACRELGAQRTAHRWYAYCEAHLIELRKGDVLGPDANGDPRLCQQTKTCKRPVYHENSPYVWFAGLNLDAYCCEIHGDQWLSRKAPPDATDEERAMAAIERGMAEVKGMPEPIRKGVMEFLVRKSNGDPAATLWDGKPLSGTPLAEAPFYNEDAFEAILKRVTDAYLYGDKPQPSPSIPVPDWVNQL